MFFMLVVLKVPVLAMIYLVWWACQPVPEVEAGDDDGGNHARRDRSAAEIPARAPARPHGPGLGSLPERPHEGRSRQPERTRSRDARMRDSSRSRDSDRK